MTLSLIHGSLNTELLFPSPHILLLPLCLLMKWKHHPILTHRLMPSDQNFLYCKSNRCLSNNKVALSLLPLGGGGSEFFNPLLTVQFPKARAGPAEAPSAQCCQVHRAAQHSSPTRLPSAGVSELWPAKRFCLDWDKEWGQVWDSAALYDSHPFYIAPSSFHDFHNHSFLSPNIPVRHRAPLCPFKR